MVIKLLLSLLLLFALKLWYNRRTQAVVFCNKLILLNLLISILFARVSVDLPSAAARNTLLVCSGILLTSVCLVISHSFTGFVRNWGPGCQMLPSLISAGDLPFVSQSAILSEPLSNTIRLAGYFVVSLQCGLLQMY